MSYKYICNVAHDYSLQNLSSLENVFIHLFDESWEASSKKLGYLISKFLVGICNAKVLHLSIVFLEFLSFAFDGPECFPTPLYNLKVLKLSVGSEKHHLQSIVHLIESSPNLEALVINFAETLDDYHEPEDEITAVFAATCYMHHLKMIEIIDSQGQQNELELINYLLKIGLVLDKMTINLPNYLQKLRRVVIIQKVLNFPKVSSNVSITFPKSMPRNFFF